MTTTLIEYSKEIAPRIREINDLKELHKEWKENDARAQQLIQQVKDSQEQLAEYQEMNHNSSSLLTSIKELNKELKLALKAAANGTDYKPAELGAFFKARAKEGAIEKVQDRSELFTSLTEVLDN